MAYELSLIEIGDVSIDTYYRMENVRYKSFVLSAEHGSFTAAGRVMGYTPSGISQLVHALEEELGIPLLIRTRNGVILSEEGEIMLPLIKSALSKEDVINQAAADIRGLLVGKMTIACYNSIAANMLPRIIKAFSDEYPNVEITLIEGTKDMMEDLLVCRDADIAFSSKFEKYPSYYWYPFMDDRIVAVIPKNHKYADADAFPIKAFDGEPFIMASMGNDRDVNEALERHGIEPNIVYTTLENFTAINMVEAGLGISLMNEYITENWDSDVVILPLESRDTVEFGLVVPSMEDASPAVRKFVRFAEDRLYRK